MVWPARSSDISPIKHLWDVLETPKLHPKYQGAVGSYRDSMTEQLYIGFLSTRVFDSMSSCCTSQG